MSEERGRFVWYDVMTDDVTAATTFYTQLIGWGTTEWEGGNVPYTMWTNNETPLGGVTALPDDAKEMGPHWLAYVGTPSVDATAAQAAELGGKVLKEPTDIPGAGQFAVLTDPQGVVFAVYHSAGDQPPSDGPPQVGEFSWHELATTDYEAAFDFYSKLFGWEKTDTMDIGEGQMYQMYGRGGPPLGGMFNKTPDMPGPPAWLHYVKVGDVDKSAEEVKELGGQILNGPMEVPGGDRIVQCMDPQGAAFALHSSATAEG